MEKKQNNDLGDLTRDGKNTIHIAASERTPEIVLDPQKGDFHFKGHSHPENVDTFYFPLLKYFDQYLENPAQQTRIIFNLEYINSSTSQMLLAILYKLKNSLGPSLTLKVEWHYVADDDDMHETGKTISELSGIPFEFYEHH